MPLLWIWKTAKHGGASSWETEAGVQVDLLSLISAKSIYSEFQASEGYIVKPYLKRRKGKKGHQASVKKVLVSKRKEGK